MHDDQRVPRHDSGRAAGAAITMLLALAICVQPAVAAFPGANGRIAYSAPNDIHIVEPDGSHVQTLPSANDPAWSPDGRRLAYRWDQSIYTVNADGSGATRLTTGILDQRPSWSPDGSKIVFSRFSFEGRFLVVVNADGSGEQRLSLGYPDSARNPAWSPDGRRIAFDSASDIGIVNADGSGDPTIIHSVRGPGNVRNYPYGFPDWSPDGKRLVFQRGSDPDNDAGPTDSDIAVVNSDGTGLRLLTDNDTPNEQPVWSPDGTKILYDGGDAGFGGDDAFHTMNSDGSGDTKLSFGRFGDSPDWAPAVDGCTLVPVSEQLADLNDEFDEMPRGLHRSLTQKLEQARQAYESGSRGRASRALDALRRKVQAQAGKKISHAQADHLIARVNAIKQAVACQE